ncbi:PHP domain-containing protein [Halocatena halophila]|uniref:PHP domain-containing protein n=1 Tax=Halocatena halophila TaxID=2814576 RepID=UPI002ED5D715
MTVADLHVHTTRSDGELAPEAVAKTARAAGLTCVAITDHDCVASFLDKPVVEREGLTLLSGIELRVETETQQLDLLGYVVQPTDALTTELERIQADRIERARAIVERVEAKTDVKLDFEAKPGVGRPHIARAIAASPIELDFEGAFRELIGNDGPCFIPRDVPSFERGRSLLAESCAFVSLAHPLRYADPESALEYAASLDGVEYRYPYTNPVDLDPLVRAIERYELIPTGGSDAHDQNLGVAGLNQAEFERFAEAIGLAV